MISFAIWLHDYLQSRTHDWVALAVAAFFVGVFLTGLAALGWLGWRYARPWLYCTVGGWVQRCRWSASTRTDAFTAPLPDPVVAGCWADVAEDEPLPIDTTDPGRALVDAYGLATSQCAFDDAYAQAEAQAEAVAENGSGWNMPSREQVEREVAEVIDPASAAAPGVIAGFEELLRSHPRGSDGAP